MKKILSTLGVCLIAGGVFAQGTVNFNNRVTASGVSAPVFNTDGTTGLDSSFVAQLWWDNGGTWEVAPFGTEPNEGQIPFRDGAGAGFMNPTG